MIYVLIWRTFFHCIVFLHNGLQITGGSDSVPFPLLLLHAAEFLNQYPALSLLIYKSNSFSIHCLEGAYFFLFHKEDFFFHNWIIMQQSQFLPQSASLSVEGKTCSSLAHHFHQNCFWLALGKGDRGQEHGESTLQGP